MRTLAIAALLFLPVPLLAAHKPDPASYTLTAHVVGSAALSNENQEIIVVIDGKRVELVGSGPGVLKLGDYHARQTPDPGEPKHHGEYDTWTSYEFLFPDGVRRTFRVIAVGDAIGSPLRRP